MIHVAVHTFVTLQVTIFTQHTLRHIVRLNNSQHDLWPLFTLNRPICRSQDTGGIHVPQKAFSSNILRIGNTASKQVNVPVSERRGRPSSQPQCLVESHQLVSDLLATHQQSLELLSLQPQHAAGPRSPEHLLQPPHHHSPLIQTDSDRGTTVSTQTTSAVQSACYQLVFWWWWQR